MKIVRGALILVTVFFSIRHGWAGITMKPEATGMLTALGINSFMLYMVSGLTLASGLLVLFPSTFFTGCFLNAVTILLMMALQLRAGNMKAALIEIPFLLMPLVMIWLGHPLKK